MIGFLENTVDTFVMDNIYIYTYIVAIYVIGWHNTYSLGCQAQIWELSVGTRMALLICNGEL